MKSSALGLTRFQNLGIVDLSRDRANSFKMGYSYELEFGFGMLVRLMWLSCEVI